MTLIINETRALTAAFSDRQVEWISEFDDGVKRLSTANQKRAAMEDFMRNSIDNRQRIESLLLSSESSLLPEEELKWISRDDVRLLRWLINFCRQPFTGFGASTQIPMPYGDAEEQSNPYRFFIRAVDFWQEHIQTKRDSLKSIKQEWSEIRRKDSKLNWLKKDDTEQIKWAWTYLEHHLNNQNLFRHKRYSPISNEEIYISILSTFDNWTGDRGKLHEVQSSMKQAWAQQKYRTNIKNNNKKQSTYVLSNKTKNQLKALAEANEINLNQMLEYIINEAYKERKKRKIGNLPDDEDSSLKS